MRHFLLVGDDRDVLGVWEAKDALHASRLLMELALSFPGCTTLMDRASDFEAFKRLFPDYDLEDVVPEGASYA
jgi:hypothetical protein